MIRPRTILGSLALATALCGVVPGIASAADYLGEYPSEQDCNNAMRAHAYPQLPYGERDLTPGRYVCASNGNPAGGKTTYSLYRHPTDDGRTYGSEREAVGQ